ncbi:GTPase IMAP family member 8 [Hoplias malabaricus]|uniref:GTPase IMAP family member 8 n=1 Tax=Hoplias malabaricus TaxID=27720 RepID=UPI0034624F47
MADSTQNSDSADDSVQIVLIGRTGSGKSSSGNTLLGGKHFISQASAKSLTLKSQTATDIINGRKVTVVDTPGWDCTKFSKREFDAEIKKTLQNLRGPLSFLLVIKVGGVESDEINKIFALRDVLGSSYLEHTTILFSHSDNLEFKTFDEFLNEGGEYFQTLLNHCGHRCLSWNNRDVRCDEDVEIILQYLKTTEVEAQQLLKSLEDTMQHHVNTSSEPKGTGERRSRNDDTTAIDVKISQRAIKVLFLGMTRAGKTSSIRTLQGKGEQIEGDVYKYNTAGLSLQLIDTPGFDENPEKIKKTITDSVSASQPHVIILVTPVGRFSPATKKTMQHVHYLLGQKATKHTLILFTRKDDLEDKTIETFIKENKDLSEFLHRNRIRFHAFNNRDTSDQRQVEELLQTIDNLLKANKEEPYRAEDLCLGQVQKKVVHGSVRRSNTSFAGLERNTGTLLIESDGTRKCFATPSRSALSPPNASLAGRVYESCRIS